MKSTVLALLVITLIVSLVNLLATFGIFGGGGAGKGGSKEYLVLTLQQMDEIGFGSIAREDGLEPDGEGRVTLKREDLEKDPRAFVTNLLPRTFKEVQEEGWKFEEVTPSNLYIFSK